MQWKVEKDWVDVFPILPVITVEGCLVWFKRCQMRVLSDRRDDGFDALRNIRRHSQLRVLPVSDIWPTP